MGKPVVCQEPVQIVQTEPQSRRSRDINDSLGVLSQNGKLESATATPLQGALHAAETYFQEVSKSSSRKSSSRHGARRALLDLLVDDSPKLARLATTQQRKPFGEVIQTQNSQLPPQVKSTITPAQADIDGETPSEFLLDDSDIGVHQSMISPPAVPSSDEVREEIMQGRNSGNVPGANISPSVERGRFPNRAESRSQGTLKSVPSEELKDGHMETEQPLHVRDGVSNSPFEWNEVFRRPARSPDSVSGASFKTGRSAMSSRSSRGSLSNEAISERAAAWGNGVAGLVIKNSSLESTPRASDGSATDGVHNGQKVPGVSKHVKDVLSSFQLAFVICDVIDPEKTILYASAGFFQMTGYSPEEVVGRNCRFLQGVDTDAKEVARIRMALKKSEAYSGTVLNYKKNGTPFWNLLTLSPIHDGNGVVIKYMGMQAEVSQSMAARRKKAAHDNGCKDVPRSMCESIAEIAPSERPERKVDVSIATTDVNGRSQGSKRYSLTYGVQGSKLHSLTHGSQANRRHSIATPERRRRSKESWSAEKTLGGSERHTVRTGKKASLETQHRQSKTSSAARPLYWLMTAARVLEDEIARLGCDPNFAKERPKKVRGHDERKVGVQHNNKTNRVASGVRGLYRKLERKVFKRETARARVPSNRVNACNSESDLDMDDLREVGRKNSYYSERQDLHCESMPRINPTAVGSISNSVLQAADVRARSSRYLSPAVSQRFDKRISASYSNEFVLDRKQFCIG